MVQTAPWNHGPTAVCTATDASVAAPGSAELMVRAPQGMDRCGCSLGNPVFFLPMSTFLRPASASLLRWTLELLLTSVCEGRAGPDEG